LGTPSGAPGGYAVVLRLLGEVSYLPRLGFAVLPLWLLTFGFDEEIGWRGFALPRLQKTMSVAKATLALCRGALT